MLDPMFISVCEGVQDARAGLPGEVLMVVYLDGRSKCLAAPDHPTQPVWIPIGTMVRGVRADGSRFEGDCREDGIETEFARVTIDCLDIGSTVTLLPVSETTPTRMRLAERVARALTPVILDQGISAGGA